MFLLVSWIINAIALYVTVALVPGIDVDKTSTLILAALVVGLVNTLIKPIVQIISLPITILTFGIFALVVNAAMLGLAAALVPGFGIDGFLSAFLGAIVLSIISAILNSFLKSNKVNHSAPYPNPSSNE
ncbi:MAG: phage holin family protein [Candidatus Woykebacteria bacterium]